MKQVNEASPGQRGQLKQKERASHMVQFNLPNQDNPIGTPTPLTKPTMLTILFVTWRDTFAVCALATSLGVTERHIDVL